ncbi:hypothetical protein RHGRI_011094 [Rhododendron griersonianum]|uniref:Uncharacterized protein n=1 Tax=Rhododendron griersonianum TaxID=479676 RepID=A0AAV6KLH8_9ERIC|nr:hypothetical protein RHGRI_011094 [Rhododendron griersonianum]
MLFVCAKEEKYVAKIENDGVVEENNENEETEEDGKGIPRKRARSCSTVKCQFASTALEAETQYSDSDQEMT